MNQFGELVRLARVESQRTQAQLADDLSSYTQEHGRDKVHQSWITRLEAGEVRWPEQIELEALSVVLDRPYELLVAQLINDRYGQGGQLCSLEPLGKARTFSRFTKWLSSTNHAEVWIATPCPLQFFGPELAESIAALLVKGSKVLQLAGAEWQPSYDMYRSRLSRDVGRELDGHELQFVPLTRPQSALLITPLVFASETPLSQFFEDSEPLGFQILMNDEGIPLSTIQLPRQVVRAHRVELLSLVP